MDWNRFIPNVFKDGDDLTDEELDEQDEQIRKAKYEAGRLGPRPTRYLTNGQMRRIAARDAKSQQRKTNRRYRRTWMQHQDLLSRFRGQLDVGTLQVPATPDMQRNVRNALEAEHGSIDAALEAYNKLVKS